MWAFYRSESEQCASKLASLHDASASLRHQLHRKLGAAAGAGAAAGEPAAGDQGYHRHQGGAPGGSGEPPGDCSPVTTTSTSLLDDPSLQYSSPLVVSAGGVLRPTPQVRAWKVLEVFFYYYVWAPLHLCGGGGGGTRDEYSSVVDSCVLFLLLFLCRPVACRWPEREEKKKTEKVETLSL